MWCVSLGGIGRVHVFLEICWEIQGLPMYSPRGTQELGVFRRDRAQKVRKPMSGGVWVDFGGPKSDFYGILMYFGLGTDGQIPWSCWKFDEKFMEFRGILTGGLRSWEFFAVIEL